MDMSSRCLGELQWHYYNPGDAIAPGPYRGLDTAVPPVKIEVLHPSTSFNVIEDASAANSRKANLADLCCGPRRACKLVACPGAGNWKDSRSLASGRPQHA